ncbi:MAG: methyl-accepting chemotaxis protein [Geminicoccales bacterium]
MKLFACFTKLKIAQKLPLYIVGSGLLVGVAIGLSTYLNAAASLEQARRDQMATALGGQRTALRTYLIGIEHDLVSLATSSMTQNALLWFSEAWEELGDQQTEKLQRAYITENPHPTGQKENLDDAGDGSSYSDTHALYHPKFRKFLRERGYYDVFLFDTDGNLIYSVYKELDYATNLVSGEWRDSDLGEAFRAARDNPIADYKAFFDFSPYAPSHGAPASFFSTPVLDVDGEFVGVLAFQMPVDELDHILQFTDGLGETGETFLVGQDLLMRSDSRFSDEPTILKRRVDTDTVRRALAGDHGIVPDADIEGNPVISAFEPFDFEGVRWALLAQMSTSEVMGPIHQLAVRMLIVGAGVAVLLLVLGLLLGRSIVKPLQRILNAISELAKGNQTEIQGDQRGDEIGDLARAMRQVYEKGVEAARLRSALDGCSTMVMVADKAGKIIYANPANQAFFKEFEADIRSQTTGFDADRLLGGDLASLHPDLARMTSDLATRPASKGIEIALGGRRLNVSAGPVLNGAGEIIGIVVEWSDATNDLAMQAEFARIIGAAQEGDFDQKIDLAGVDGVYRELGGGMNQLTCMVAQATDELGTMLEAMASGDLDKRIEVDFQGKFGKIKDHANRTADELTRIVSEIQDSATEVRNAASEITTGTEDLSHRTEQAAANLEETAASSEELAATVRQNAENAKNANGLAGSADQSAKTGGAVVEQAVSAMAGIEGAAKKINDIIGVIDEIAFQTNLLALNASVEAARAGEAGKGFAVVAQEVRQLAQRSAKAASDIKTLIDDSNVEVQEGVQLVNRAGEALSEIVGSIGKVTGIVQDIANASQEQTIGVQEINSSITSLDEMTQQNSALVEESSASARALSDEAGKLAELMAFFKIGNMKTQPIAKKPVAAPSIVPTRPVVTTS